MASNYDNKYEDFDILFLMRLANRQMRLYFNNAIDRYNLTSQQANLLIFLTRQNANGEVVHQQDIEKWYRLSKSTISGMIDRLVKRGLVKRIIDGRYANIVPTEEAIRITKELRGTLDQYDLRNLAVLTDEEQEEFKTIIIKLLRQFEKMKEEDKHVE